MQCSYFLNFILGLVLVTDAISAMGLEEGTHRIGQLAIEIREGKAFICGTNTLCGSIATMNKCVQLFQEATGTSLNIILKLQNLSDYNFRLLS